MSALGLAGSLSGILAFIGVVYSTWSDSRTKGQGLGLEGERLGHEELVDALEFQRKRIEDLEKRTERAERREAECNRKVMNLERQVTNLLYAMEMKKEDG